MSMEMLLTQSDKLITFMKKSKFVNRSNLKVSEYRNK